MTKTNRLMTLGSVVLVASLGGARVFAADLSDAKIEKIMQTANEGEIKAAKTAKSKATNKDVVGFAKHMIDEHEMNNKEGKKVFKAAKITPEKNEMAEVLETDTKNKISDMKKLKGADFDRAYIESQVAMHQDLLNNLDQKFIPGAENPDLKAFLSKTREHVQAHLEEAKRIQGTLTK